MLVFIIRRMLQSVLALLVMSVLDIRWRIRDRQSDRHPDQSAGRPGRNRARDRRAGTRPADVGPVLGFCATRCRRSRPLVFAQRAGRQLIFERMPATLELALCAMVMAIVLGIPLGLVAGLSPSLVRQDDHGRLDPRLLPAHVLGRPDADHGVLGVARLAALDRARRHRHVLGVPVSFLTSDGLRT